MSIEYPPTRPNHPIVSRKLFEDDQLYSAEEVRQKLGGKVHIITIWRWARQGRLPAAIKIAPNTSRFLGSDLNRHLLPEE